MRIAHLINGLNVGGAEMMLQKLIGAAPTGEVESLVISMLDVGPIGRLLQEEGVEGIALEMERGRPSLRALSQLVEVLRRFRPHVLQTWMYHANLMGAVAAPLARVSNLVWGLHHANLDPSYNKAGTLRVAKVGASLARFTKAVVCCSEQTRVAHAAIGYPAGKMVVIPNGFDVTRFHPDAAARRHVRAELDVGIDAPLVGMVARYDPLKDLPNFVAASARLRERMPDVRFVLCGDGLQWDNPTLTSLINDAGARSAYRLLGRRADVPSIMAALDVHVLSSAGEGFPNVLGEAMACGTPCVTTDVGDAAFIVGNTGRAVPPRDAEALAQGIAALLSDADGLKDLSRRARERVIELFSLDAVAARYYGLYESLCEDRGVLHH